MRQLKIFCTIFAILTCFLQAHGADKYTDENRPYEFGFTIDGEQHRHEKKDDNGIIMGEFGFITADGVYHVTVYATDENGNFKILSMKNIRMKPYPSAPTTPARQGNSLPFPPSQNPPKTQGPPPLQPRPPAAPIQSCSSCSIPTTKAPVLTDYANVARDQPTNNYNTGANSQYPGVPSSPQGGTGSNYPQSGTRGNYPQEIGSNYPQGAGSNYPQGGEGGSNQQEGPVGNYPQSGAGANYPQGETRGNYPQNRPGGNYPQGGDIVNYPHDSGPNFNQPGVGSNYPQRGLVPPNQQGDIGAGGQYLGQNPERNPKRIDDYPQQGNAGPGSHRGPPQKPTLISAQMQIVDKNTDIYHKNPGEKDGLPQGLNKGDMLQLLYTFNYTVGFHAHYEEGYTNGAKQGYYYVTGRNGVRTRIDYVADEKGFRPKITEEVLDLVSEEVPKPETEKDLKYGLKGYEFKWLYYPVESKVNK